mgnify:CR=1 FL=1
MRTILPRFLLVALSVLSSQPASAIVGYYNTLMQPGVNLVANQLNTSDNSINSVLTPNYPLLDGATFTKWNGGSFLTPSIYDATTDSWSINYSLNLGEGGYLTTPTLFTNTFVGEVVLYPPLGLTPWTPNYADGLHLISSPLPIAGNLNSTFGGDTMFEIVVGRTPVDGEGVAILDPTTQTYSFHVYMFGGWFDENLNSSAAILSVGHAAWFALGADLELGANQASFGIPVVPEPTAVSLLLASGIALMAMRNKVLR